MNVQGKFKMQAHSSCVVMDVAAFKVSHSVDKDATALRAARARSSSIGAMERYTWVRFAGKLTPCHTHSHGNGQHTSGAMERFICGFEWHKHSRCPANRGAEGVSNSVGRWDVTCVGSIWRENALCPATSHRKQ